MIRPVEFPEMNKKYVLADVEDSFLPAFQNEEMIISCWKVTDEDLEIIKQTGVVWLRVYGKAQPPVIIQAELPFIDPTPFPEKIEG